MKDKKLDVLIKVGVGLIFLSVLIFATSTWNDMNSFVKEGLLVLGTLLFYGLSVFTGITLKLEKSSFMYYIISMILLVFSFIAAGVLEIFGTWYSFAGDGCLLFWSNLLLIISALFYRLFSKKNNKPCLLIAYYVLMISLFLFSGHLELKFYASLLIIGIIMNIFNYYIKDKYPMFIMNTKVLNGVFFFLNFVQLGLGNYWQFITNAIYYAMMVGNYFLNKPDNKFEKAFLPIGLLLTMLDFFIVFRASVMLSVIIIGIATLIYFLLTYLFNKDNKETLYTLFGIHNLTILISSIMFFFLKNYEVLYFTMMVSSILVSIYSKEKIKASIFSLIYKIILLTCALGIYFEVTDFILISLLAVLAGLAYFDKKDSVIYYWSFNGLLLLSLFFINTYSIKEISNTSHLIFGSAPLFIILNNVIQRKKFPKYKNYVFVLSLLLFELLFIGGSSYLNAFWYIINEEDYLLIGSLMYAGAAIMLYFYSDNNLFNKISLSYALLMPILAIMDSYIMINVRYVVFIYCLLNAIYYDLVCHTKSFDKVLYICALLFLFESGEVTKMIVLLWVCCIIYLFAGYNNSKYKALSIGGLIILVCSLLVNLYEFWTSIPVYVYLFLLGVAVIVFVTIKEIKKNKKSDENETNSKKIETKEDNNK